MGATVAIRQLCESAERRKLAWEATRRLYQLRKLVADLPKLVVKDPVGLADDAPTGPEALMGAPRELGIERDDQMLQRRAQFSAQRMNRWVAPSKPLEGIDIEEVLP